MSETVNISKLPIVTEAVITDEKGRIIALPAQEVKPDTFEKKHSITPMGVVLAGAAAAGTGKLAFEGLKKAIGGSFNWFEQQAQQYAQESGKIIKGLSQKAKANIKFGLAGIGALAITALVFKDKDKDGKLDILEAAEKFKTPEN